MNESRKEHRGRTYLGGQIVFNNKYCTMDCLVRNLSTSGAKLVFPSTVGLPSAFELTIREKNATRRGRIIWMDETHAGFEFLDTLKSDVGVSDTFASNVIPFEPAMRSASADRKILARRISQVTERLDPK